MSSKTPEFSITGEIGRARHFSKNSSSKETKYCTMCTENSEQLG